MMGTEGRRIRSQRHSGLPAQDRYYDCSISVCIRAEDLREKLRLAFSIHMDQQSTPARRFHGHLGEFVCHALGLHQVRVKEFVGDTHRPRTRRDALLHMACDLEISPLAVEIILQALRPVVLEHFDIKTSRASVADIKGVDVDGIDDV